MRGRRRKGRGRRRRGEWIVNWSTGQPAFNLEEGREGEREGIRDLVMLIGAARPSIICSMWLWCWVLIIINCASRLKVRATILTLDNPMTGDSCRVRHGRLRHSRFVTRLIAFHFLSLSLSLFLSPCATRLSHQRKQTLLMKEERRPLHPPRNGNVAGAYVK